MLASFAAARMSETIVVGGLSEVGGEWRVSSDGDEDLVFRNGYEVSRG
ncbi:MAG TPA: hypothetical protein VFT74_16140 [Isosphaeraceae bacterium]|nr:hypothetical protein [Isosphaeraceae bacterium]